jgi:hypothetical protein
MRERARERRLRPIHYRRDLPHHERPGAAVRPVGSPVVLEQVIEGEQVECPGGGAAWVVMERIANLDIEHRRIEGELLRALGAARGRLARRIELATDGRAVAPQDLIFLDLETTGLANCPVFLIGTMQWHDGGLEVRQYFARHYAEERGILEVYRRAAGGKGLLVSFNGKSFDVPFLRLRALAWGVPVPAEPPHFDLLHECRRLWRGHLPDCRLQTLEAHVCGRRRTGDIPSAEIPEAYHAYVRTGDAWQMVEVVRHNMLDLLTMADLMCRLAQQDE